MAFDPSKHMIRMQGNKEYLMVCWRLVWFREDHPDWGIVTTPVEINLENQYAIFSAQVFDAEGNLIATATKMENVRGFGDYIEKAETGAVGRALAYCGYGTQFAPELEEGESAIRSPVDQGNTRNNASGGAGASYGAQRPRRLPSERPTTNGGVTRPGSNNPGASTANDDNLCHCGEPVEKGRAAYCLSKGIPISHKGQCEEMVGAPR